ATTITRGQPITDASGTVTELYGTVLDITDRKAKEDRLSRQVRRLQSMLDWVDRPVFALSRDSSLLAAAAEVRTLIGRDHICTSGGCRFETSGGVDLQSLSGVVEVEGQFTVDGRPVGPTVRVRLE